MTDNDPTDFGSGIAPAPIIKMQNTMVRIEGRIEVLIERTHARLNAIQQGMMAFEGRLERIDREQVRQAVELRKGVPVER